MVLNSKIVYGKFKEEIKNRFLCTVNINGANTICYIPSSCRLSNFINLTDRMVMLQPIRKKNARTKYSVYAVKYRKGYVPLNLANANRVVEENIRSRRFSFLGNRKNIYREKYIDGYKSDLYIADTDTVVEIKSILSFGTQATFPTVFSERANRQLKSLKFLLEKGHKVCYMFIAMYSGTKNLYINKQQTEYVELFSECIQKGMVICAFSLGMNDGIPFIKAKVEFE